MKRNCQSEILLNKDDIMLLNNLPANASGLYAKMGISPKGFQKHRNRLENLGFLKIVKNPLKPKGWEKQHIITDEGVLLLSLFSKSQTFMQDNQNKHEGKNNKLAQKNPYVQS